MPLCRRGIVVYADMPAGRSFTSRLPICPADLPAQHGASRVSLLPCLPIWQAQTAKRFTAMRICNCLSNPCPRHNPQDRDLIGLMRAYSCADSNCACDCHIVAEAGSCDCGAIDCAGACPYPCNLDDCADNVAPAKIAPAPLTHAPAPFNSPRDQAGLARHIARQVFGAPANDAPAAKPAPAQQAGFDLPADRQDDDAPAVKPIPRDILDFARGLSAFNAAVLREAGAGQAHIDAVTWRECPACDCREHHDQARACPACNCRSA